VEVKRILSTGNTRGWFEKSVHNLSTISGEGVEQRVEKSGHGKFVYSNVVDMLESVVIFKIAAARNSF